jgi:hypothetical protein
MASETLARGIGIEDWGHLVSKAAIRHGQAGGKEQATKLEPSSGSMSGTQIRAVVDRSGGTPSSSATGPGNDESAALLRLAESEAAC